MFIVVQMLRETQNCVWMMTSITIRHVSTGQSWDCLLFNIECSTYLYVKSTHPDRRPYCAYPTHTGSSIGEHWVSGLRWSFSGSLRSSEVVLVSIDSCVISSIEISETQFILPSNWGCQIIVVLHLKWDANYRKLASPCWMTRQLYGRKPSPSTSS